ncbi:hypothetical protein N0V88_005479 [Collariella sp. IMI 366227]|nr:hypothetical protein N0V88_005479 [Collariella sp. IMI 366227]
MTPAVVYFPAGTYLISSSILPAYFTQLIGDAASPPTLKATANFAGFGLIDGNPYYSPVLNWKSVNVFFRQVRNFILDTTAIPPATAATGMHWPTSQATSLQNIVFNMPTTPDVVHVGLFIEEGSGGFMTDLTFNGGASGASMGNQQYTMRNLRQAIIQIWNWGWTYHGLSINNCQIGIDMSSGGSNNLNVGSVTLIDSTFTNVPVAILTARTSTSNPATAGSLILENILLTNVPTAILGPNNNVLLPGTTTTLTIPAWATGHSYTPSGPIPISAPITPNPRPPPPLTQHQPLLHRSKPQYESLPATSFLSVRAFGAVGNAATDDTFALQSAIDAAVAQGKVLFLDYGLYRVTSTIRIPPSARIVGESFPVILSAGPFFNDMNNPRPVVQVGSVSGQQGRVELSDFIIGTQNAQAGAVCVEWNLRSDLAGEGPSGMWDVHVRIGGFTGTQQQVGQYIESEMGPFWLWGTGSEHHVLYQYQLANTRNIFMGQIQTETPYFQPVPNALVPSPVPSLNDPDFAASCAGVGGNCASAWGLRIINSRDVLVYGAGLYSFFDNYSTACSTFAAGDVPAEDYFGGGTASNVNLYNLNTIGARSMINRDGAQVAWFADNVNTFASNVAVYKITAVNKADLIHELKLSQTDVSGILSRKRNVVSAAKRIHSGPGSPPVRRRPRMQCSLSLLLALRRDGYVIIPSLLSRSEITTLRAAASHITALARAGKWPHVRTVGKQFPPWDASLVPHKAGIWGVQHLLHPDLPVGEDERGRSRGLF